MILRCTQKLLEASGSKPEEVEIEPEGLLGEWYANTVALPFRGRSVVMFTSASTLLTVVAPGKVLRTTVPVFRERLPALLHRIGLPAEWVARQRIGLDEVRVTKTRDRHVLGCMNDLAYMLQIHTEDDHSFDRIDWDGLENRLSRNLLSYQGYEPADRRLYRLAHGDHA